jgi:flagellar basal body-associated protein FliL
MRAELIVLLVCLGLMVAAAVFCYICIVVASDADRRAEEAEKELEKEKEEKSKVVQDAGYYYLESGGEVEFLGTIPAKKEGEDEHKD